MSMDHPEAIGGPSSAQACAQARRSIAAHQLTVKQRLMVMALNAIPFLHALALLCVLALPWAAWPWKWCGALAVLYILPALAARGLIQCFPLASPTIALGSPDFFKWWTLLNLQVLFCRFPCLDELLRLVPALYSAWLRLWGARIGRLVYWSPGTQILDRAFLEIGDDVIFGAGVRLNPHVMVRDEQGQLQVLLAPIKIGARAIIGGYSLLTAGSEIPADECTRAFLISPPFSQWQHGRRVKA